jgi:hypothetical protein
MAISPMSYKKSTNYCINISSVKEITAKKTMTSKIIFYQKLEHTAKAFFAEVVTLLKTFSGNCHTGKEFFAEIFTPLKIFSVQETGSNQQHFFMKIFSGVTIYGKNFWRHANCRKR